MQEEFDTLRFQLFVVGATRTAFTRVNNEFKVEYCRDGGSVNIQSYDGSILYGYLKVTDNGIELYKLNPALGTKGKCPDSLYLLSYADFYGYCSKLMMTKSFKQFCCVLEEAKGAESGDLNYATWVLDGFILYRASGGTIVTVTPVCDSRHTCRVIDGKLVIPKEYGDLYTTELREYIMYLVEANFQQIGK